MFLVPPSFGQSPSMKARKLLELSISLKSSRLAAADIQRAQTLRVGDLFHASAVASTIDGMFATGRYEDIQVDAVPEGDGVTVRFLTQPARFIGHVSTSGKYLGSPNRAQIIAAGKFDLGAPFHPELLEAAQKQISTALCGQWTIRSQGCRSSLKWNANSGREHNDGKSTPTNALVTRLPPFWETPSFQTPSSLEQTGWRVRFIGRWSRSPNRSLGEASKD